MALGRGELTTRRQPRPASSATFHPFFTRCSSAFSRDMKEPIGLFGFWKAGSCASTRTWVTTETARRCKPARRKALRRAH